MYTPPKILVVDDDPEILFITTRILEGEGYEILSALSGREAYEKAVKYHPDLILMDVMLPDRLGTDVMVDLKKDPVLATSLIILISSIRNSSEEKAAGLDSGADGYLARPISNKELKLRIKALLEHKSLLEALRESEKRLETIINKSADGILVIDPEGTIRFANPAANNMFNMHADTLHGKPFGQPILLDDKAELDITRGRPSPAVVEMRIVEIGWDNTQMTLSTLRDVTDRKMALLKVERLNELLLAHQQINQRIVRSLHAEEMLQGICNDLMESRDYLAVFTVLLGTKNKKTRIFCSGKEEITRHFPAVIRNQKQFSCQKRESSDNPVLVIENIQNDCKGCLLTLIPGNYKGFCSALVHHDKNYGQLVVMLPNEVEQNKEEEELLKEVSGDIALALDAFEVKQRSNELERVKTSLLQNMNHEVRTPMNAIIGFSNLICQENTIEDIHFMASRINKSADRLMQTLEKVLEISDLHAADGIYVTCETDLVKEITDVAGKHLPRITQKGLGFSLIAEIKPVVSLHTPFLTKALEHLIDNAIKFTQQGKITIEVKFAEEDQTKWIEIRITDSGIGIPDNQLSTIFDAFRQVSEGYNRSYEGSGLGLTLAYMMVTLMKGQLVVSSEHGKGSTFTIKIPYKDLSDEVLVEPVQFATDLQTTDIPAVPGTISEMRILIVEDNEDNAELIKIYLKNQGLTDAARNAETTLDLVQKNSYDLILMDINLGSGMDGLHLTKMIRELPGYKDVPVVAMTGYTHRSDKERFFKEGCTHYLPKPVDKNQLYRLLDSVRSQVV